MNQIEQLQKQTRIIGSVLLLLIIAFNCSINWDQFFRSYLFAYVFALESHLGCMAILFIYHLAGGAWGAVSRRIMEAAISLFQFCLLVPSDRHFRNTFAL